jgi:hypothetical protein
MAQCKAKTCKDCNGKGTGVKRCKNEAMKGKQYCRVHWESKGRTK